MINRSNFEKILYTLKFSAIVLLCSILELAILNINLNNNYHNVWLPNLHIWSIIICGIYYIIPIWYVILYTYVIGYMFTYLPIVDVFTVFIGTFLCLVIKDRLRAYFDLIKFFATCAIIALTYMTKYVILWATSAYLWDIEVDIYVMLRDYVITCVVHQFIIVGLYIVKKWIFSEDAQVIPRILR